MRLSRTILVSLFCVTAQSVVAAPPVETAPVETGLMTQTVSAFGVVEASPSARFTISTPVNGQVAMLDAQLGARVEEGQIVAEIATGPAAQAKYAQARAAVSAAEQNLMHMRALFDDHFSTRDQIATAEQDLANAEADLQSERNMGSNQKVVTLRAPRSGIVTNINTRTGERISADTSLLEIAELGSKIIQLGVEPADLSRISAADEVALRHIHVAAPPIQAAVKAVSGRLDPQTGLVNVLVEVDGKAANRLILGETLKASVKTGTVSALSVPRAALVYEGESPFLYIIDAGVAEKRSVTVLNDESDPVFLGSGVKAGEQVAITNVVELRDGAVVDGAGQ